MSHFYKELKQKIKAISELYDFLKWISYSVFYHTTTEYTFFSEYYNTLKNKIEYNSENGMIFLFLNRQS